MISATYPELASFSEQLKQVQRRWPDATLIEDEHGGHVLEVPGIKLPAGWTPEEITMIVRLPPGFPCTNPRWFYTREIVLFNGQHPFYSRINTNAARQLEKLILIGSSRERPNKFATPSFGHLVFGPIGQTFMWTLQAWHWRNTMITYVYAMRQRFMLDENRIRRERTGWMQENL